MEDPMFFAVLPILLEAVWSLACVFGFKQSLVHSCELRPLSRIEAIVRSPGATGGCCLQKQDGLLTEVPISKMFLAALMSLSMKCLDLFLLSPHFMHTSLE